MIHILQLNRDLSNKSCEPSEKGYCQMPRRLIHALSPPPISHRLPRIFFTTLVRKQLAG